MSRSLSAREPIAVPWTAPRFFELLQALGRVRVISICGPSVFEAICRVAPFEVRDGFLNLITDAYHWHLALDRIGHLRSRDTEHARSGRRVLFFELAERADAPPFLRIYVFRAAGEAFDPEVLTRFEDVHRELADGVALAAPGGASA